MTERITFINRNQGKTDFFIGLGLVSVILFFLVVGIVAYWNTRILTNDANEIVETHQVILAFDELLSLMKDAETGQRGYLITGDEKYLEPYTAAIEHANERINTVKKLIAGNKDQEASILTIETHVKAKFDELNETVVLRRTQGFEAAKAVVVTDKGKNEMDIVRTQVNAVVDREENIRKIRMIEMDAAYNRAVVSGIITALIGMLLSGAVASLISHAVSVRRRQQWMQSGEAGLGAAMLGELRMEQLGENILKFLAEFFGIFAGAFFIKNNNGYRRVATYGVPADNEVPEYFSTGEGLLGQAARDKRSFFIHNVPDGYLTVGSALGQGKPKHLAISPAIAEGEVNGVLELGFIYALDESVTEFLQQMADHIGMAVRSANYRSHLQNLLEETQRQAEELQTQSEELRVSNEELEEQSRALKQSQANLEEQQAELEQTNSQLEEQTQLLEGQKDTITRAKSAIQLKADQLEKAGRYKSDFLANMSHELRTPLNSSLILSKLLADNPEGNLTEEQVKFATTIHSSGNDLLTLIGDILDLSKIEAGHMELKPETISLANVTRDLQYVFESMAQQKGLTFHIHIDPSCPQTMDTDSQRLKQILNNLLANAIKFTEKGTVRLDIKKATDGQIVFSVIDSGIGIAKDNQELIFDAFRQADSTINRKYGGTGLGLSIARELIRLLGGTIEIESEIGKGSTFRVILPEIYDQRHVRPQTPLGIAEQKLDPFTQIPESSERTDKSRLKKQRPASSTRSLGLEDDRDHLTKGKRTILVIEDDISFARILFDVAHELNFQCLLANTTDEALIVAKHYLPQAVILDVGLPDHSGLIVLDRLKHDPRTRHIPVHVISASDYIQTALSLGAIGYMLKPVKHEDLVASLKNLEARLAQHVHRILIVEDDAVQRDSIGRLLRSKDVETIEAGTASECLDYLKKTTVDCMVLDLTLPDASGYALLETLSKEESYVFPPVIVYTGRDLSGQEEQRLRRYSKSIIIKGAKSPERLLDEVTLFLHQVVADLPPERQRMLEKARNRDSILEGRHILVVEDDIRNVYSLTSILEPRGALVQIARNGREAIAILEKLAIDSSQAIDLVLMDVMMPEMDGLTATRLIREKPQWRKLPIIMLTAKAMQDDQEKCMEAGASDYMAKPLDVEKLLSLVRVWMPR